MTAKHDDLIEMVDKREALKLSRHVSYADAPDPTVERVWDSLSPQARAQYAAQLREQRAKARPKKAANVTKPDTRPDTAD